MAAVLRLFFDKTEVQVLAIRDTAIALIAEGKTLMSVGAGGKSGSRQFPMQPADIVRECNAALRHINPTRWGKRHRKTVGYMAPYEVNDIV